MQFLHVSDPKYSLKNDLFEYKWKKPLILIALFLKKHLFSMHLKKKAGMIIYLSDSCIPSSLAYIQCCNIHKLHHIHCMYCCMCACNHIQNIHKRRLRFNTNETYMNAFRINKIGMWDLQYIFLFLTKEREYLILPWNVNLFNFFCKTKNQGKCNSKIYKCVCMCAC